MESGGQLAQVSPIFCCVTLAVCRRTTPFLFDQNRMFFCDCCFQLVKLTITSVCGNGFSGIKQLPHHKYSTKHTQEDLTSIDVGIFFSVVLQWKAIVFTGLENHNFSSSVMTRRKKKKVLFHSFTSTLRMEDLCNLFSFGFGVLRFVERINPTLSRKSVS